MAGKGVHATFSQHPTAAHLEKKRLRQREPLQFLVFIDSVRILMAVTKDSFNHILQHTYIEELFNKIFNCLMTLGRSSWGSLSSDLSMQIWNNCHQRESANASLLGDQTEIITVSEGAAPNIHSAAVAIQLPDPARLHMNTPRQLQLLLLKFYSFKVGLPHLNCKNPENH